MPFTFGRKVKLGALFKIPNARSGRNIRWFFSDSPIMSLSSMNLQKDRLWLVKIPGSWKHNLWNDAEVGFQWGYAYPDGCRRTTSVLLRWRRPHHNLFVQQERCHMHLQTCTQFLDASTFRMPQPNVRIWNLITYKMSAITAPWLQQHSTSL